MDRLRKSVALTAVAAVVVLAAGWFLLISPKNAQASGVREQVAVQDQANQLLQTELEVLRGKAEELPAKQAELADVAVKLPPEPGLPDLLRALSAAATSTGVELVSVSPGSPSPLTPPAAAPAAPPPAAAGADPATATAGTPQPAAPAAPPAGTVLALPITVNVIGTFYDVEAFVTELEELPRAVRLTGLALAGQEDEQAGSAAATPAGTRSLSTTLTGEVYIVADSPAALAAPGAAPATATAPAPAPVGTGSAAPSQPADAN